ncbi:hypothetical protein KSP40_PGU017633 [Platanthera guangdongensis]|uniref:Uncharacterized protein n=1 Tax=Platanthera guangdongensis TaxID=2320717 RepID=A0ABR2MA40_9ASPA
MFGPPTVSQKTKPNFPHPSPSGSYAPCRRNDKEAMMVESRSKADDGGPILAVYGLSSISQGKDDPSSISSTTLLLHNRPHKSYLLLVTLFILIQTSHMIKVHNFPFVALLRLELSLHGIRANRLVPTTCSFFKGVVTNKKWWIKKNIRCGTGALAIFIRKYLGVDITTSDFDDKEVEENIVHNCKANEVKLLPHVRHTWGEPFPISDPNWDLIIASDILLYVKQYPNLIKTLSFLLKSYKQTNARTYYAGEILELSQPVFLMSWRRRIGGEEAHFFSGCEHDGLSVKHIGSRVYCISPRIDA